MEGNCRGLIDILSRHLLEDDHKTPQLGQPTIRLRFELDVPRCGCGALQLNQPVILNIYCAAIIIIIIIIIITTI
jgi:hypothetical protein